jgi:hypothetical protein
MAEEIKYNIIADTSQAQKSFSKMEDSVKGLDKSLQGSRTHLPGTARDRATAQQHVLRLVASSQQNTKVSGCSVGPESR